METTLKITGNWNELKTKLKQKYPNLTDTDLNFTPGKEDALLATLSKKLGKTQEEISDEIDNLQSKRKETSGTEKENQMEGSRKTGRQEEGKTEGSKEKETSKKY
ncbi:MAG: hypothetical protein A3F72_06915 [Bacteroidetes bacterium RIFCSPLOWO2_12_FULL_35_15]|nr:MAG: hypothetical protein A3F72_06915 [Bacteroidetes bacterium RIFCSPLOWO2_12_FULL_35_15]